MAENKGHFKKGNSGRPKGSANKLGATIKAKIAEILEGRADEVANWLDGLESDKDKLFYYTQLLPFVVPKMKELTGDTGDSGPKVDYESMSQEEKKVLFELLSRYTRNTPPA